MSDLLYHYTNATGLIGILSTHSLWASDARFLNDSSEMIYARERLLEAVRLESAKATDPVRSRILRYIDESMRDQALAWPGVYVACFCEQGDLLSQWRGYGREQGYAIGFDKEVLRTIEIPQDVKTPTLRAHVPNLPPNLVQVVYGERESEASITTAIQGMGQGQSGGGHWGVVAVHEVGWYVLPELARLKHPSFREEQEWRLVFVARVDQSVARFRPTSLGVVPYIEIPLPSNAIKEIVLGPGNHPDLRRGGVRLLANLPGWDLQIRVSEAPLRT